MLGALWPPAFFSPISQEAAQGRKENETDPTVSCLKGGWKKMKKANKKDFPKVEK